MEQWAEIRRRVLTGEISKREAYQPNETQWTTLQKVLACQIVGNTVRSGLRRRLGSERAEAETTQ